MPVRPSRRREVRQFQEDLTLYPDPAAELDALGLTLAERVERFHENRTRLGRGEQVPEPIGRR